MNNFISSIGIKVAIAIANKCFKYLAKKQKVAFNAMIDTISEMNDSEVFGVQVTINEQYREALCTAIEDGNIDMSIAAEVVKFVKYIYANAKLGSLTEEIKLVGTIPENFVDIVLENSSKITSIIYKLTVDIKDTEDKKDD